MGRGAEIYFLVNGLVLASVFLEIFPFKRKLKHSVMLFWAVFLTFFAGLRWNVGTDWTQYYEVFRQSDYSNVFSYNRNSTGNMEWLFVLVNAGLKSIVKFFWLYNLIICGFVQFTHYYVLKKVCPEKALLAFCILYSADTTYFAVRSQLAMAVFMWGIIPLKNSMSRESILQYQQNAFFKCRSFVQYFAACFAAFSVHKQSIVMFLMYWIGKVRLKWYVCFIVFFSFLVFSVVFSKYLVSFALLLGGGVGETARLYAQYDSDGSKSRSFFNLLLDLCFLSSFLFVRVKQNLQKDGWYNALLNMFLVQSAFLVIFSGGMSELSRLALQFAFARAFLIVEVVRYFEQGKNKVVLYGVWIFLIGYMFIRFMGLDSWYYFYDVNVPYKTIFDYSVLFF